MNEIRKEWNIYVADMVLIWLSLQLELIRSPMTHQWSFGGWPRKTYDDTWKPFNMFGVTHKKNSFLKMQRPQMKKEERKKKHKLADDHEWKVKFASIKSEWLHGVFFLFSIVVDLCIHFAFIQQQFNQRQMCV